MKSLPKLVKVERAFLARVRCVCEAIVRIDSEEEEAPSLEDTARAALLVLEQLGAFSSRRVR